MTNTGTRLALLDPTAIDYEVQVTAVVRREVRRARVLERVRNAVLAVKVAGMVSVLTLAVVLSMQPQTMVFG